MEEDGSKAGSKRLIGIGIAGLVMIVAAAAGMLLLDADHVPAPPPQVAADQDAAAAKKAQAPREAASSDAPAPEAAPAQKSGDAPALAATAAQDERSNTPAQPPAADAAPSFDVVRLSQEGDTVLAGRAAPGAEVTVRDGDKSLGTVKADERGEWVLVPTDRLAPGSRALTLEAKQPDGTLRKGQDQVVVVVPEPGKDIAGRPAATPAQEEPLALLVPAEPKAEGEAPVATRVLQRPSLPGSVETASGDLTLDVVDYDADGNLRLSGRGLSAAGVAAYLDNNAIGTTIVDARGLWTLVPDKPVAPGVYTLRLDQLNGGKVVSRLELPFSRAAPLTDFAGQAFVVVQPGNSLWRIARRVMGEGDRFTVIYQANKDQITDPDLIYPGQIFEVPVGN